MSQVIGAELQFESVHSLLSLRRHHDTSIIDEQVQAVVAGNKSRRKILDGFLIGQIKQHELNLGACHVGSDGVDSLLASFGTPAGNDHMRSFCGEGFYCFVSDAAVAAGYNGNPTGLVRHQVCCPFR